VKGNAASFHIRDAGYGLEEDAGFLTSAEEKSPGLKTSHYEDGKSQTVWMRFPIQCSA
jgi:hypothetical protein